jgi:hypothetical protein
MYQVPVSSEYFVSSVLRYDHVTNRHDSLYAAFLLVGVLGTFKAYLTLADPGLFLSMIVLFPETFPCS